MADRNRPAFYEKKCLHYYAHSAIIIVGREWVPARGTGTRDAGDRRCEMLRITDWFGKTMKNLTEANADWNVIYEDAKGMAVILGPGGKSITVWYDNDGIINAAFDGEKMSANCYGSYNGRTVYGKDNWVYTKRGFGAITSDRVLMEYAEKVSYGWSDAGWHHKFEDFYLSDYALAHPRYDLTDAEFNRLKELHAEAIAKRKAEDDAREWRYVRTIYWADNSEEEIWVDKNGVEKTVMTVAPHGDLC